MRCGCDKTDVRAFRNRVDIQSGTAWTDGNPGLDWSSPTITVRGWRCEKKEFVKGESPQAGQVTAIRRTVYKGRHPGVTITPQMRISDGTTTRNITDVIDPGNGRGEFIEVHCLENAG